MASRILIVGAAVGLAIMACAQPVPSPAPTLASVSPTLAPTASVPPATATALPATSIPTPVNTPTALPVAYHLDLPPADHIRYDFVDHICEAQWANGAHFLSCPGDGTDPNGSAQVLTPQLGLAFVTDNKALLTVPAYGNNNSSIFGHYPTYTVQAGDTFKAAVTVAFDKNEDCALSFGLDYYDAQKQYHSLIEWPIDPTNALQVVSYDLSPLQGQAVDFSLAVRYQGHNQCEAVWVAPLIYQK